MAQKVYNVVVDTMYKFPTIADKKIVFAQTDYKTAVFEIEITEEGLPFDLTGYTVKLAVLKSDRKRVYQDATIIDAALGVVEVVLNSQSLAAAGETTAELEITNIAEDSTIVTNSFKFYVKSSILSDESIESDNEFPVVQRLEEKLDAVNEYSVEDIAGIRSDITVQDEQIAEHAQQIDVLLGVVDNKFSYSYFSDGNVQTITEKDSNDTVISTTTFTYKTNGDVDTSVLVRDGKTITTQYVYDPNGNLTDTTKTIA